MGLGGRAYESTLLGTMLSVSCLPSRGGGTEVGPLPAPRGGGPGEGPLPAPHGGGTGEGTPRFFERPSFMSQSQVDNTEAFLQPVGAGAGCHFCINSFAAVVDS